MKVDGIKISIKSFTPWFPWDNWESDTFSRFIFIHFSIYLQITYKPILQALASSTTFTLIHFRRT